MPLGHQQDRCDEWRVLLRQYRRDHLLGQQLIQVIVQPLLLLWIEPHGLVGDWRLVTDIELVLKPLIVDQPNAELCCRHIFLHRQQTLHELEPCLLRAVISNVDAAKHSVASSQPVQIQFFTQQPPLDKPMFHLWRTPRSQCLLWRLDLFFSRA